MEEENNLLEQKFERLFITHFPTVKNFALMLLKSVEDAEDIAQEIFLKLWTTPELWSEDESIDGYLYVMTRNAIFNFIKHRKIAYTYRNAIFEENLRKELFEFKDPLDEVCKEEILLIIRMTLERLPQKRREIFELSRFSRMSHKEIAEKLKISIRTVEHQVYLTLLELKKTILLLFFPLLP